MAQRLGENSQFPSPYNRNLPVDWPIDWNHCEKRRPDFAIFRSYNASEQLSDSQPQEIVTIKASVSSP
jgi:hypothetical protein